MIYLNAFPTGATAADTYKNNRRLFTVPAYTFMPEILEKGE